MHGLLTTASGTRRTGASEVGRGCAGACPLAVTGCFFEVCRCGACALPAALFTGLLARAAAGLLLPVAVLTFALAPAALLAGLAAFRGDAAVPLGAAPAVLAVGLLAGLEDTSLEVRRTVTVAVLPALAIGFEPVTELRSGLAVLLATSLAPSSFLASGACKSGCQVTTAAMVLKKLPHLAKYSRPGNLRACDESSNGT